MKKELFELFGSPNDLSAEVILARLSMATVIGLFIFLSYRLSHDGSIYSKKFNVSLVTLTIITTTVMIVIGNNLAMSLGMVGALSIVRFRTAVKDSRDTVFIFWAIAEGLSVGSQNFKLALVTTLFIGIVIAGVSFIPGGRNKYLMIVRGREESIDHTELMAAIRKAAPYIKLRSLNKEETHQEMIFEVRVRGELGAEKLNQIFDVKGVKAVNWVAESGENVG